MLSSLFPGVITVQEIVLVPPSEGEFHEGGTVSVSAVGTVPVSEQVFTKYLVANRPHARRACIPRYGRDHWKVGVGGKKEQSPLLGLTAPPLPQGTGVGMGQVGKVKI